MEGGLENETLAKKNPPLRSMRTTEWNSYPTPKIHNNQSVRVKLLHCTQKHEPVSQINMHLIWNLDFESITPHKIRYMQWRANNHCFRTTAKIMGESYHHTITWNSVSTTKFGHDIELSLCWWPGKTNPPIVMANTTGYQPVSQSLAQRLLFSPTSVTWT
jgi:hypothetical protein